MGKRPWFWHMSVPLVVYADYADYADYAEMVLAGVLSYRERRSRPANEPGIWRWTEKPARIESPMGCWATRPLFFPGVSDFHMLESVPGNTFFFLQPPDDDTRSYANRFRKLPDNCFSHRIRLKSSPVGWQY